MHALCYISNWSEGGARDGYIVVIVCYGYYFFIKYSFRPFGVLCLVLNTQRFLYPGVYGSAAPKQYEYGVAPLWQSTTVCTTVEGDYNI